MHTSLNAPTAYKAVIVFSLEARTLQHWEVKSLKIIHLPADKAGISKSAVLITTAILPLEISLFMGIHVHLKGGTLESK